MLASVIIIFFWLVYGPRRSLAEHDGKSRAVKIAPFCKLGWPITAQDLVHLGRSKS